LWTAGVGLAGGVGWWAAERLARLTAVQPRRWTGSREEGSYQGNEFPVTSMARDGQAALDPLTWRLQIGGPGLEPVRLSYPELMRFPQAEEVATLDCTVGWFTTQRWQGVRITDLLREAGWTKPIRLVRLEAVEGYWHIFASDEIDQILLATHVGGEPLAHRHGFPLRAVVPTRRGWFWVKWLGAVRVLA
jgi:DMSO/TMAO reductase YedYZ molybdopterin-dependent catalytic subunit